MAYAGVAGNAWTGAWPRVSSALLDRVTPNPAAARSAPGGQQCDLVVAPIDRCCGVFDQLVRLDAPVPPMACLGDVMLFLVRLGSAARALASSAVDCKALGIEIREGASWPSVDGAAQTAGSWIMPLSVESTELPLASTAAAAIQAAHVTRNRSR